MTEVGYYVTQRLDTWDARGPDGKLIGVDFKSKRSAQSYIKRYLDRRGLAA